MAEDDTNGADLWWTNAHDVKTIYNHVDITNTHWVCLHFVQIYILMGWNPFSLTVSNSAIMNNENIDSADLQWANAGDVKTIYNHVDITNTH